MDDSSNPYSATGGPTTSQAEDASVDPIDVQTGSSSTVPINPNPIADNPIVGQSSQRILNRHIVSSASRGNQTITGQTIVNDPVTSNPVIVTSGPQQNIVFSDPTTQTPRVVEGLLPDGSYGMWVSQPEVPVTGASADQLIFNSNQDILKIVKTEVVSVDFINSPFSSLAVPHTLGFAPIPFAFLTNVTDGTISGNFPFPVDVSLTVDSTNGVVNSAAKLRVSADAKNVYFECMNATGSDLGTFNVRYYLLQESSGLD